MKPNRKGMSSNYCVHGTDIFKTRPVSIFDIETKERTDFASVTECAKFFNTRRDSISSYIRQKARKNFNGKKYAIRYKSSIKTP